MRLFTRFQTRNLSMEIIKGDLVLIPFPFTDLSNHKLRPAVVLFSNDYDVTVCFITSKIKWKDDSDLEIKKSAQNGLKTNSLLKISKIATLDKDLLVGQLGSLRLDEISEMNEKLKILLKLK